MTIKEKLFFAYHLCRANSAWNKMVSIAAHSYKSHGALMDTHAGYREASIRYNQSINALEGIGKYTKANTLIAKKVGDKYVVQN